MPKLIQFPFLIITNANINNPFGLIGILSFIWFPIAFILQIYIGSELLIPEKKRYVVIIFSILGIIFEVFIFFNIMDCLNFVYPSDPGDYFILSSISGIPSIIRLIFIIFLIIFNGFGLLIKSFQFKGSLKIKFIALSATYIYIPLTFLLSTPLDIWLNLNFIFQIFWFYLIYYGLTPEKIKKPKKKKKPSEKEVRLVSYLSKSPETVKESKFISTDVKKEILVFLSYATKEANLFKIEEISSKLINYEEIVDVLYWQKHLHDNFIKFMNENLGRCDVFILFCSEKALNSIPVEKEWTAADALNKPIIPVYFDAKYIPPLLSSRLGMKFDEKKIENAITNLHSLILRKFKGLKK